MTKKNSLTNELEIIALRLKPYKMPRLERKHFLKRLKSMYSRRMNSAFASDALILQLNKSKTTIVEPEYQNVLRRVEFPVH